MAAEMRKRQDAYSVQDDKDAKMGKQNNRTDVAYSTVHRCQGAAIHVDASVYHYGAYTDEMGVLSTAKG